MIHRYENGFSVAIGEFWEAKDKDRPQRKQRRVKGSPVTASTRGAKNHRGRKQATQAQYKRIEEGFER